jgi:hypothetical protein
MVQWERKTAIGLGVLGIICMIPFAAVLILFFWEGFSSNWQAARNIIDQEWARVVFLTSLTILVPSAVGIAVNEGKRFAKGAIVQSTILYAILVALVVLVLLALFLLWDVVYGWGQNGAHFKLAAALLGWMTLAFFLPHYFQVVVFAEVRC